MAELYILHLLKYLDKIREDGAWMRSVNDELKMDREFIMEALTLNAEAFPRIPEKFRLDKEFILEVLKRNGAVYEYLKKQFKKDLDIMIEVAKQSGTCYRFFARNGGVDLERIRLERIETQYKAFIPSQVSLCTSK